MATLAITIPAGGYAGTTLRALARALQQTAGALGDQNATGASVVLTVDNAPATGVCSVAITAGPVTTSALIVG